MGSRIVAEFISRKFPICQSGTTRFHEEIRGGMVADVRDGSIDELLSAPKIVVDGELRDGPRAPTALVLETGSKGIALPERVKGHGLVFALVETLWEMACARGCH